MWRVSTKIHCPITGQFNVKRKIFCDGSELSAAFVLFLYFSLEVAVVTLYLRLVDFTND